MVCIMEENNNDNQNNVQENSASKEDKPSFLDNAKDTIRDIKDNKYKSRKNGDANNGNSQDGAGGKKNKKQSLANKALNVGANYNPLLNTIKQANDMKNKLNDIKEKHKNKKANQNNKDDNKEDDKDDKKSESDSSKDTKESEDKENKPKNPFEALKDKAFKKKGISDPLKTFLKGSLKVKIAIIGIVLVAGFITLLLPVLIIVYMFGSVTTIFAANSVTGDDTGDIEYKADNKDDEKFQEDIKDVVEKYPDNEQKTAGKTIASALSVLQYSVKDFNNEDMTKKNMEKLADVIIDASEEDEDGNVTYTVKSKDDVLDDLADVLEDIAPGETDSAYDRMAQEVYDSLDYYDELIGKNQSIIAGIGSSCAYNVDGNNVSNIKVRLMQSSYCYTKSGSKGVDGEALPDEELVDFEKYVLGVAYGEIGESAPEQAFKAQMILARTYALNRAKAMNGSAGVKLVEENGQWILQIRNCVSDQAYCDPDKGCRRYNTKDQNQQVYTGSAESTGEGTTYKGPLPEDSPLRQWAQDVQGKIIRNSDGSLNEAGYVSSVQNRMIANANSGMDYTDILVKEKGAITFDAANCTAAGSKTAVAYVNWMLDFAKDESHGYSQDNRTLPDVDCSSFVYYALINNGWTTSELGGYPFNTTTMGAILKKAGFQELKYDKSILQVGDILVNYGSHTEVVSNVSGATLKTVGAHSDENGERYGRKTGDQTGQEVSEVNLGGWSSTRTRIYRASK